MSRTPWKFEQEGTQRIISSAEYALISKLLSVSFSGSAELQDQLDSLDLRVTSRGQILKIDFLTQPAVKAKCKYQIPVEANSNDLDGMEINVSLHVVDGLLYELEVYRVDGEGIAQPPAPNSLHDFFLAGEPF